jgi:hypothetical protein
LLFQAEPYSWRQLETAIFIVIGICMFVHGMRKLTAEPVEHAASQAQTGTLAKRKKMQGRPDYENYSETQLRQVLTLIDAERFPDRVAEVRARLANIDAIKHGVD